MTAEGFVVISNEDVTRFLNTKREREQHRKGKAYDLKIFREFLESCDEKREVAGFYSHKKKEFMSPHLSEPFVTAVDCYLRKYLRISVLNDNGFSEVQGILKFPGLEITAGQRTMSGLIGELTSQLFVLPVMLTGHNRSY